ncbi:MAG: efflux RND transporter periplasmic adaptor subunit [Mariprofundales bacterium]
MGTEARTNNPPTTQAQQAPKLPQSTEFLLHLVDVAGEAQSLPDLPARQLAIVNRTAQLFPHERGTLLALQPDVSILAAKGVAQLNKRQPLMVQRLRFAKCLRELQEIKVITADDLPENEQAAFVTAMQDSHVLWLPLRFQDEDVAQHVLLLERPQQWQAQELALMAPLAVFYATALRMRRKPAWPIKRWGLIALLVFALGFIPVPVKIVSPGHVRAQNPVYLTAPLNGTVQTLHAHSGMQVKAGDLLLEFDPRALERDVQEADAGVEAATAELQRLRNSSFDDPEARASMQLQQVEIRRRQAKLVFLREQQKHVQLYAPQAGVIQIEKEEQLTGKPVQTGERLGIIGMPEHSEWVADVPVGDIGHVRIGQEVLVHLDHDPLHPRAGIVHFMDFEAGLSLEQVPSVRAYIRWSDPKTQAPPGEHGSMHISGNSLPFWYAILRKPLGSMFARFGWW